MTVTIYLDETGVGVGIPVGGTTGQALTKDSDADFDTAWTDIVAGLQGPPGPRGPAGADSTVPGPQGPAGNDGADSTVPGPQGPQGAVGADSTVPGPQGPAGADSTVPGPQGPVGAAGADSTVPGPQGPAGADGADGQDGADSTVPGPQGIQGPPGNDGADSTVPGPTGPAGADSTVPGPTGPTGATGATGATGPAGVVAATAPITYNSGTQTVGVTVGTTAGTVAAGDDTRFATLTARLDPTDPANLVIVEDFPPGTQSNGGTGTHGWRFDGSALAIGAPVAGHPGIANLTTGATATNTAILSLNLGAAIFAVILASDLFDISWIVRPVTVDSNTVIRVGLWAGGTLANNAGVAPTSGAYLEKLGGDTTWFVVSRSASSETRSNTGVTALANTWVRLRIRRTNSTTVAGSVGYSAAMSSEFTVAATTPTTAGTAFAEVVTLTTAAKSMDCDYCSLAATGLVRY